MLEVRLYRDGGQSAVDVARQVAEFLGEARETLELALYDIRLTDEAGDSSARCRPQSAASREARLQRRPPRPDPGTAAPRTPELIEEMPLESTAFQASRTSCTQIRRA